MSELLKNKAKKIYYILMQKFGPPDWTHLPALDEMMNTLLSQNTNDRNRDMAYASLRQRYPSWEAVRDAPLEGVVDAIRSAGLANQKGARMQHMLRQITAERGDLNLDFLNTLSVEEAQQWLTKFNGIGPKTASIVLLFSLKKPAFPVDTHIYRVSGRLGLRPEKMPVEEAHTHLAGLFDPSTYGPAHINLIRLGRQICHARKPDCANCPLTLLCDFNQPPSM